MKGSEMWLSLRILIENHYSKTNQVGYNSEDLQKCVGANLSDAIPSER
jgi:hypothetical protein